MTRGRGVIPAWLSGEEVRWAPCSQGPCGPGGQAVILWTQAYSGQSRLPGDSGFSYKPNMQPTPVLQETKVTEHAFPKSCHPACDMGLRLPLSQLGLVCPRGPRVSRTCQVSVLAVGITCETRAGESSLLLSCLCC